MKNRFAKSTLCVAALLLCFAALPLASAADRKPSSKTDAFQIREKGLPDLQVKEINLTRQCELQATIANIGKAGVPESCYGPLGGLVIKVFKGVKLESTIMLAKFDPHKKLKVAGETVTHVWPSSQVSLVQDALGKGLRVVADAENMLKEADESNNELSRELKCPFKPAIIITHVDPSLQDLICWYRQHPPNKFKCKVYWFTKFYFYSKIRKIDLICQNGSQDGNNFYLCSTVYPIATEAPNSGEYQFDLPYVNEIGDFVLKIYGYGGAESPPYPVCIW